MKKLQTGRHWPRVRMRFTHKPSLSTIPEALLGALLAAAALAAVLLFGAVPAETGEARPMPETFNAARVDAAIDERDERRFLEEESRRQEEESRRRAEEESRRLAEAERGYHEAGWQSAAEKEVGSNDPAVWKQFRDYAVLGDSRAVGFAYYRYLEWDRVLASGGDTIRRIPDRAQDLKRLQPKYVFFCYGLNDAGIGNWKDGQSYAEEFMEKIEEIRTFLPDAKFVVSSIIPVTDQALKRSPSWKRIELFNAALAVECPRHNVAFVDNDGIAKQYMDTLWNDDGVHLHSEFYPYWANNLMEGLRRARTGSYYETATAPAAEERP